MGVVRKVVHAFKVGCAMVVIVVDSTEVDVDIGMVTELDGIEVVVVLEVLENFGV